MLTLSAVRQLLWHHASNVPYSTSTADDKAAFDRVLNQVLERFLKAGYSDTQTLALTVYEDVNGNPIVTLPRELNSVIGALNECDIPLTVRGNWYDFLPNSGGGSCCNTAGIIKMPGRYTTYRDWNTPYRLRIKMEKAEAARFLFRGKYQGDKIYTDEDGTWIEGVVLDYVASTVTTTELFDEPPYSVVKPITEGRVTLWIVDSDDVETQVAIYDPNETVPRYLRYKVPSVCVTEISSSDSAALPSDVATQDDIDALFGGSPAITVSAVGSQTLAPSHPFAQWFQRIVAQAGVGNYTHKFALSTAQAKTGAIFRVSVELALSSNQTIEFYSGSDSGTLLDNGAVGDSSQASWYYAEFYFNGTDWEKLQGGFLL